MKLHFEAIGLILHTQYYWTNLQNQLIKIRRNVNIQTTSFKKLINNRSFIFLPRRDQTIDRRKLSVSSIEERH